MFWLEASYWNKQGVSLSIMFAEILNTLHWLVLLVLVSPIMSCQHSELAQTQIQNAAAAVSDESLELTFHHDGARLEGSPLRYTCVLHTGWGKAFICWEDSVIKTALKKKGKFYSNMTFTERCTIFSIMILFEHFFVSALRRIIFTGWSDMRRISSATKNWLIKNILWFIELLTSNLHEKFFLLRAVRCLKRALCENICTASHTEFLEVAKPNRLTLSQCEIV